MINPLHVTPSPPPCLEQLKDGLFAAGPPVFEAYNGSFYPPVTGFYYVSAIVHLNVYVDLFQAEINSSTDLEPPVPETTVSVCLRGSCSGGRAAYVIATDISCCYILSLTHSQVTEECLYCLWTPDPLSLRPPLSQCKPTPLTTLPPCLPLSLPPCLLYNRQMMWLSFM